MCALSEEALKLFHYAAKMRVKFRLIKFDPIKVEHTEDFILLITEEKFRMRIHTDTVFKYTLDYSRRLIKKRKENTKKKSHFVFNESLSLLSSLFSRTRCFESVYNFVNLIQRIPVRL